MRSAVVVQGPRSRASHPRPTEPRGERSIYVHARRIQTSLVRRNIDEQLKAAPEGVSAGEIPQYIEALCVRKVVGLRCTYHTCCSP